MKVTKILKLSRRIRTYIDSSIIFRFIKNSPTQKNVKTA